jgi:pyruvate/2-oxoglutarate dehydrogenase complex dihydrolipoamide acyltransferase (E2) component
MPSNGKSFFVTLMALLLVMAPALSPAALAQAAPAQAPQHVVSAADLQNAVAASVKTRQANEAKVESFLSSPRAQQTMKKAGLNYQEVRQGIPFLSSSEVAELSARADRAQKQFEAGALTNQQITYIIIALAAAVIVLIAVKA